MRATLYIAAVVNRATLGTATLTDRLSIFLIPFATLIAWLSGVALTDTITEALAIGVALTVMAIVSLRLLVAPFLIWRDDAAEKATLSEKLFREQNRLDNFERQAGREYALKVRTQLSDNLAKMIVVAELLRVKDSEALDIVVKSAPDYISSILKCREMINQLSYDIPLRIGAHNLLILVSSFVKNELCEKECEGGHLESQKEAWKKIDELKKVVFRLLHKQEPSKDAELVSLFEIKNIIGADEDVDRRENDGTRELAGIFRQAQDLIKDPELLAAVREGLEGAGAAGFDGMPREIEKVLPNSKMARRK